MSEHENDDKGRVSLDLKELRLSQDFDVSVGVKKVLLTVPVRRPDRQWFVRVHPDEEYRLPTAVLELKDEREIYLVDQSLLSELPDEVVPRMLFTAINRQDVVFLWPVPLPKEDGRILEWHRSLMQAAEMAIKKWVRVNANMALGAYEVSEATGALPEPGWPDQGFVELLEVAFRDRYIRDLDHPALQRLKGVV